MNRFVFLGMVFLLLPFSGQALQIEHTPVPGGVAVIRLPDDTSPSSVRYNGKRVMTTVEAGTRLAIVGLSLGAQAGTHHLEAKTRQGAPLRLAFEVRDKAYETQHITIKDKRKVNPEKRDMERIGREQKKIRAALAHWSDTDSVGLTFLKPVQGPYSSPFGLRRFFNEQPRKPHSGIDIAAPEGTDIRVTADGRVIEAGDFFFSGNMVYVDHGQGLVSLYAHLSRIDVKPGDELRQGDIIGAVGQTGRVTGAHLHFAIMTNGVLVDPVYFLPGQQPTAQLQ